MLRKFWLKNNNTSITDKNFFYSLLKDFTWQLETEKYLYEQGNFSVGFLAMGCGFVAASYGLSYLKNMSPSCIMDACESDHAPIMTSADFVCAPNEIAFVCLKNMKNLGVKHLSQFAKCSRECFP